MADQNQVESFEIFLIFCSMIENNARCSVHVK